MGPTVFDTGTFLQYFIASQMRVDHAFAQWVLEESNFLRFISELEYYAGLERDNEDLLNLLGKRFDALNVKLTEETGWTLDLTLVGEFQPPGQAEDLFTDIEDQLATPALTAEERDEVLDWESPKDAEDRQEVYRPIMEDVGQEWTACLMLYSGMIKNKDLVNDDAKRTHLRNALRGWAKFAMLSLLIVPKLVEHRKLVINGVLYEIIMPRRIWDAEVAKVIFMELPLKLADFVTTQLGSEKLERQLLEVSDAEEEEPIIVKYFR